MAEEIGAGEVIEGSEAEYARLLEQFEMAMLVTRGPDGHFRSRPMACQQKHHGRDIWFATSQASEKIRDIEHDARVGVSFHGDERDPKYVSISGTAEIVRDRETIRAMWEPGWRPWFPEGADDPELVLVKVTPEHVEWVDPPGGKLKVLATMAKRTLTGSREEPGEKHELDLH